MQVWQGVPGRSGNTDHKVNIKTSRCCQLFSLEARSNILPVTLISEFRSKKLISLKYFNYPSLVEYINYTCLNLTLQNTRRPFIRVPIGRVATGQVDGSGEGCTQVNKFEQFGGQGREGLQVIGQTCSNLFLFGPNTMDSQTDTTKIIISPQTTYAGGEY